MLRPLPLSAILGASVRAAGEHVGVVGDVFADDAAGQVVGLEVLGSNDRRWFLPWVAASFHDGVAEAASPLVLIPAEQLDFYLERGRRLAQDGADGVLVEPDGRLAGIGPEPAGAGSGLDGVQRA